MTSPPSPFDRIATGRLDLAAVRAFAEAEIGPNVREWDESQHFPTELLPKLGALGLMGIQIPEALGGAGIGRASRGAQIGKPSGARSV